MQSGSESSAAKRDPWDGCTCPAEGRHLPSCPTLSAATVEQRLATRLACPHKHTYVKRTPPTWASDPYPALITEECEDCGKLVAVTNVERPKS